MVRGEPLVGNVLADAEHLDGGVQPGFCDKVTTVAFELAQAPG